MSSPSAFNGSSVSSGSPLNSPHVSPVGSPYMPSGDLPWDQFPSQFSQQMSLQPPSNQSSKSTSSNTFVHKLYNMVVDTQYQHLIAWNHTGTSFIVCNIIEFSRDVLPKHFKHNNFSSFVRQLNMYGFHKVNKSPRGHRTLAENQIWEFSHAKFLRGRPDLLDEIKRKAIDNEVVRRDANDMNSHMAMMQSTQSDMMQQLAHLQDNFAQVVHELAETRKRQAAQQQMIKSMMDYLSQQGDTSFQDADLDFEPFDVKPDPTERPPPIYVTSHDANAEQQQQQQHNQQAHLQQLYIPMDPGSPNSPTSPQDYSNLPSRSPSPLTVQTLNLHQSRLNITIPYQQQPQSPSALSAYQSAVSTPLPLSPGPFLSDDEASIYSPQHSPHAFAVDSNLNQNSNEMFQ